MARLVAGFAADQNYTISCAVGAVSVVAKGFFHQMDAKTIRSLEELMIFLIRKESAEIYSSILKFFKIFFKHQDKETLLQQVGLITSELHDSDKTNFSKCRNKIKTLIQVLSSKLSDHEILENISPEWLPLYKNLKKTRKT